MFILPTLKGLAAGSVSSNAFKNAALDLNFASNKSLADAVTGQNLVTFTRASSATYVDSDGVLQSAVTNLVLQSEEFDNATWTKNGTTVTPNASQSPTGSTTADLVEVPTSGGSKSVYCLISSLTVSSNYTLSFYAKAGASSTVAAGLFISTFLGLYNFTLTGAGSVSASTAGVSGAITAVGNGWYRCQLTVTTTGVGATLLIYPNSISNVIGNSVYLWGAQLEQASTAGEYVPTTSTINSAPRFDHNPTTGESLGLLVEEARTNLLLRSEEFDNASWTKNAATITANATVSPNGTTTADKLVETAVNNSHWPGVLSLGLASNIYTVSVYAKAAERTELSIFIDTSVTRRTAYFNLSNGTLGAISVGITSSIQSVGNGWYRCSITLSAAESLINVVYTTAVGGNNIYLGDGTSGIYLWGAQLEAGAFPTSYIPTTTATVTRAADVATITGTNFSSWYNAANSSIFAEWKNLAPSMPSGSFQWIVEFHDGTNSNRQYLFQVQAASALVSQNSNSGGPVAGRLDAGGSYVNTGAKAAAAFAALDRALVANGGSVVSSALGALPIGINQANIGSSAGPTGPLNGTIKRLVYWGQRLPSTTLQAITTS
jgi:hypothetical protein